jgi:hypothetical protein
MKATAREVIADPIPWLNAEVTIDCYIVVADRERSFVVTDIEEYERGSYMQIADGGEIARQLLRSLPPYVGGICIYYEDSTITGTLRLARVGLELGCIRCCRVTRDGKEVIIRSFHEQ